MVDKYRVKPGKRLKLKHHDPDDTGAYKKSDDDKAQAKAETEKLICKLDGMQERLYANGERSLLIVLQGMDTSGKDSTIKSVMSGVNPQGCRVATFKTPSSLERAHDFLWRVHQEAPPKGHIGIFNRSHYEDVLITRVHGWVSDKTVKQRFGHIKDFEELLTENGTSIIKLFLHISKDEQKKRLEERIGILRNAGSSTRVISKNANSGIDTCGRLRMSCRRQARTMLPGMSCRPIANGIGTSWLPIWWWTPSHP